MSPHLDHSISKLTQYTVDSWTPPEAYGGMLNEVDAGDQDDKNLSLKRSKSLSAGDMNAFWSASNILQKSQLPLAGSDDAQRLAFSEEFSTSRKARATVSTKVPPYVLGFLVGNEDQADKLDAVDVNVFGVLCAAASRGKTTIWALPSDSSHTGQSTTKTYNSFFLPNGKQEVQLATGSGTTVLAFAPDAPAILSATANGQINLWSVESGLKLVSYTGIASRTPVWSLDWCPSGTYFASASGDACARIWRSDIPFPIRVFESSVSSDRHCHLVKWHPTCQLLAAAYCSQIVVYAISTSAPLFSFPFNQATSMKFSPTGYLLAAANRTSLSVWETNTGNQLFHFDTFSTIVQLSWTYPSSSGLGDGGLKSVLGTGGVGHPVLISIEESGKIRMWDRLFLNKPSACELQLGQPIRCLHMHVTPRNLVVVAGCMMSSESTTLEAVRGLHRVTK